MSDFKNAFRRKHKKLLSDNLHPSAPAVNKGASIAGATQNAEIKYQICITFDELLLLALQYVP
jgi:hypothetical protein